MKVTAWNNGRHSETGAGYGVKLSVVDHDRNFECHWEFVVLELESGSVVKVNIAKRSFWNGTCRELISQEIGKWFIISGIAPWPRGKPPKLQLLVVDKAAACFKLCRNS